MLADADQLPDGTALKADLCVCGAGAAGIAIALELNRGRRRVLVLEGGGRDREDRSQDLYAGTADPPLDPSYLRNSRLRYFGGTTNHWLGYCRPLDPIDFEKRPWVPHSGWPFGAATLEPFYRRAAGVCRIEPDFGPLVPPGSRAGGPIWKAPFRVEPTRFAKVHGRALRDSRNVEVLLHANLLRVRLDGAGGRVDRLEAATLGGRRFAVRARHYVLALGGIENARALLVSDNVQGRGIGNQHDLVGRFFMDHPGFRVASFCASGDSPWTEPRSGPGGDWLGYRLTDEEQRRREIGNGLLSFDLVTLADDLPHQLLTTDAGRALAAHLEVAAGGRPQPAGGETRRFFSYLGVRPEMAPDPRNRVTLGDRLDAFGQRRTHLAWQPRALDVETVRQSLEVLAHESGRHGLARIRVDPALLLEAAYSPGFHHIGTTRMHDDPRQGVVDGDGRVHGVANLFVAGSSVFPTAGYANPTLTLVALALRLADHLKGKLG